MGEMRQCPLPTLLTIITLVIPVIAGAAQPNTCDNTSPSPSSQPSRFWSPQYPRWTASGEAIIFDRVGTKNRTLVERVPGYVSFADVPTTPGSTALKSNDLNQGFSPGFRLGLAYHINPKCDLESSFFRISEWDCTRSIGPDNPPNWLVMRAPGAFFQTQDFAYQSMTWDYSTDLYNVEVNVKNKFFDRLALLAGFRWLQLNEDLQGTIPPPDRILPLWKLNPKNNLYDVARIEKHRGIPAPPYPPFWDTTVKNNLYGLQLGADGKLLELKHFSINALLKGGCYLNHASESTGVSLEKVVYKADDLSNGVSFVGETGVQCRCQVIRGITLKFGYEVLWLAGVAVAPGQIQETYTISPATVYARGVNTGSNVFFHGVTMGLELLF